MLAIQLIISISYSKEKFITPTDAASHVGKVQTGCGIVASEKFASQSKKHPTFLNLDQPFPKQIFTIVIWGSDRAKFKQPPKDYYMVKKYMSKA